AIVRGGEKGRSSNGKPNLCMAWSISAARAGRFGEASIPAQKTLARFALGKKPRPRKWRVIGWLERIADSAACMAVSFELWVSPRNFSVRCIFSGRIHFTCGVMARNSLSRAARAARTSGEISMAMKRRMGLAEMITRALYRCAGFRAEQKMHAHHVQSRLRGEEADHLAIAGKMNDTLFHAFRQSEGDVHGADGFFLAAA